MLFNYIYAVLPNSGSKLIARVWRRARAGRGGLSEAKRLLKQQFNTCTALFLL